MIRYFLIFCLFLPIYAKDFSNIPLKWHDENECRYSFEKSPKSFLKTNESWFFKINSCKKKMCNYSLYCNINLKVFCPKIENYCTITDSFVVKVFPTPKQRKEFCNNLDYLAAYYGQTIDIPFEKTWGNDNVIVGCDFVEKKNEDNHDASGLFILNNKGSCPIWLKSKENLKEYDLYILDIEKKRFDF